jgi:hypothetical protein
MTTRVLLTGSRTWTDWHTIVAKLDFLARKIPDLLIIHGACARGADDIADRHARAHGIRTERHPANWRKYGRRAGHVRNAHMVALGAELCLAFIRDNSPGASGCAAMAEAAGISTVRFTERSAA